MPWYPYPPLFAGGACSINPSGKTFDVIVVSGDAYVDHPLFPTAVITRLLERLGVTVAVIAQPDWRSGEDFRAFGRPRLFFAVTAGAMDSMVANYTSMRLPRKEDRLSPGGRAGMRPKRAVAVYCQRLREAFPGTPIVIGGIEASLRRFSHFDFWENRIRDSIMVDSGADLLVYGMAEPVLHKIVGWYKEISGQPGKPVPRLPQTCVRVPGGQGAEVAGASALMLPTAEECRADPRRFLALAKTLDGPEGWAGRTLVQPHPKGDIVCFPPEGAFREEAEMISAQHYNRRAHPLYTEPVPALVPVQFSVVSHRGCLGLCTFCALALHQGRKIRSRPESAILEEIARFPSHPDFRGTVPDLGGPSVNMYGWACRDGGCPREGECLAGEGCSRLGKGLAPLHGLLEKARKLPGIKHVFLGSGLRYDLIGPDDWAAFEDILRHHVSGQLKVAPEHLDPAILRLMRKGAGADFPAFVKRFREMVEKVGLKQFLVPYFMTAFPGTTGQDRLIAEWTRKLHLVHEQIQEFTPTPGTLATAMYFAGIDLDGKEIPVPRDDKERKKGRGHVQGTGQRRSS